jgi:hypothetical protein
MFNNDTVVLGLDLRKLPSTLTETTKQAPAFRKDVTPLNRTPGGLMEQFNASLQRGRQG